MSYTFLIPCLTAHDNDPRTIAKKSLPLKFIYGRSHCSDSDEFIV